MRILIYSFDQHPCPGGVDTFVRQMIKGLRGRGHTVDFLCSSHIKFLPELNQKKIIQYQSFLEKEGNLPKAVQNIEVLKFANEQLFNHIDVSSYDLIHSNNGVSSYVSKKFAPSIPLFGTVHGVYYRESLLNEWVSSFEEADKMKVYDIYAIECPTMIHTVSNSMVENMPMIYSKEHVVIHNGLNVNYYQAQFSANNPLKIASSGVINNRKGYDLMVEAINILKQRGVKGFELVIYGDGPMKEHLEQRSKKLELPIEFCGMVQHDQLRIELSKFDIFIHPARFEPFGLSVTEAMASGCAVICTRVGGLTEQVVHEDNGLLFELNDIKGLANSIERLIKDTELRKSIQRRGVQVVKEKFSQDIILDQFESAYEKTINLHKQKVKM